MAILCIVFILKIIATYMVAMWGSLTISISKRSSELIFAITV